MGGWLEWLFSVDFMPSMQCIKADPLVVTARLVGDGMFFLAYMAIPWLLRRYRAEAGLSLALGSRVVAGFMAFIFFCGISHLDDILMLWWPARRADAVVRLAGGVVSLSVAWMLSGAVARYMTEMQLLRAERDEWEQTAKESQARLNALRTARALDEGGLEPAS